MENLLQLEKSGACHPRNFKEQVQKWFEREKFCLKVDRENDAKCAADNKNFAVCSTSTRWNVSKLLTRMHASVSRRRSVASANSGKPELGAANSIGISAESRVNQNSSYPPPPSHLFAPLRRYSNFVPSCPLLAKDGTRWARRDAGSICYTTLPWPPDKERVILVTAKRIPSIRVFSAL